MPLKNVSLGLGEYLTLWVVIAVVVLGFLGLYMGVALGGAAVFVVGAVLAVMVLYAILSRGYRLLLHGSITGGDGDSGGDAF